MTQMLRIKNGFFTFLISENLLNLRPKTALTYLLFYEFRGEIMICRPQIATHKSIFMKDRKKHAMSSERKKIIQNPTPN
jgi:hypothetical protein